MTNPSKIKRIDKRRMVIIGSTVVCSAMMTSAFGSAAMATTVDDSTAASDASVVEVVDLTVSEPVNTEPAPPAAATPPAPVVEAPPVESNIVSQPAVVVDQPTEQVAQVEVAAQVTSAPVSSAPADVWGPTVTIKTDGPYASVQSNNQYGLISFKLFDAGKVDKVVLNGVVKDLANNTYSDLNGVKPGVFGAVSGKNVLEVYDVAGNVTTVEFTLDNVGPSATVKVEGTVGSEGLYQKVSYKLNDPAKVVKAIINGVEKPLTPDVWSDLNNIVPGTFGAVEGLNTLVLVDALGNKSTYTFTLDTTKPVVNVPASGQWVSGTHTWNITQTEANPAKTYVEIQQLVDGKWKKFDGAWFYDTNDFNATFDTTKLTQGLQTQIKVSTWDKVNLHSSATFGVQIDNTAPTITVKPESIGSDGVYRTISFKLFDGLSGVDKVSVNGKEKDLTNNNWSDLNGVTPKQFGAVEGENTIVLYDVAGNTTTYVVTLDITAPTVINELQEWQADKNRNITTLTFDEPTTVSSQGWTVVKDTNNTVWWKAIFNTKEYTVEFTDKVGNPGTYTFKAKGQSELVPPVIDEPEVPAEPEAPVDSESPAPVKPEKPSETPVVTEPAPSANNTAGNSTASVTKPASQVGNSVGAGSLAATGGNSPVLAALIGALTVLSGLSALAFSKSKISSMFGR